eukprot:7332532-Karenia_brevis.AAC.1
MHQVAASHRGTHNSTWAGMGEIHVTPAPTKQVQIMDPIHMSSSANMVMFEEIVLHGWAGD